jgi:hypothetical protein
MGNTLLSQTEPCGTYTVRYENYSELTKENKFKSNVNYVLPITIHIITEDNGNHEVNEEDLINEINISNSYFNSVNI